MLSSRNVTFHKPELLYLGHIIGKDGIKVDPAEISCIAGLAYAKLMCMNLGHFWDLQIISGALSWPIQYIDSPND